MLFETHLKKQYFYIFPLLPFYFLLLALLPVSSLKVFQPPQLFFSAVPIVTILSPVFLSFSPKYQEWLCGIWFATETFCMWCEWGSLLLGFNSDIEPNTKPQQEAGHIVPEPLLVLSPVRSWLCLCESLVSCSFQPVQAVQAGETGPGWGRNLPMAPQLTSSLPFLREPMYCCPNCSQGPALLFSVIPYLLNVVWAVLPSKQHPSHHKASVPNPLPNHPQPWPQTLPLKLVCDSRGPFVLAYEALFPSSIETFPVLPAHSLLQPLTRSPPSSPPLFPSWAL